MTVFLVACAALLGLIPLVVLLSYTFAWYEAANSNPDLLESRFAPASLARGIWLVVQETFCLALALASLPLGLIPVKENWAPVNEQQTLIFLHGLFQNRACWWFLRLRLYLTGYRNQLAINLPAWHNVETLTERLAKTIDQLRLENGAERVILIGHSMGGIIARNYLQRRGGSGNVSHCLQLGSPNQGSKLAPFALSPLGRLLLPQSPFLTELNRHGRPAGVRLTSIFSHHDNLVIPPHLAAWPDAEQIALQGIGHTGLLFHPKAFRALCAALKEQNR